MHMDKNFSGGSPHAMPRLAILIAPNFPPANKISSLRPYYLAIALRDADYRVFVLASQADDLGLPRSTEGMTLKYVAGSGLLWWVRALRYLGGIAIRERRVDWIISTYGPSSAHVLGAVAKLLWPFARWIADYRDIWTTGSYYGSRTRAGWKSRLKSILERALLLPSWAVVSVSPTLLEKITSFHRKQGIILYNGFEAPPSFHGELEAKEDSEGRRTIRICYTGTIYPERSPLAFIEEAWKVLESMKVDAKPDVEIVLAGMIDDGTMGAISEYIRLGLVRHLGVVTRQESYELQRKSDFCLLVEDFFATSQGVLTGKLFEYLGQRKSVIALGVEAGSDMERILADTGLGAYAGGVGSELTKFLTSAFSEESHFAVANEEKIGQYERQELSRQFVNRLLVSAGNR